MLSSAELRNGGGPQNLDSVLSSDTGSEGKTSDEGCRVSPVFLMWIEKIHNQAL